MTFKVPVGPQHPALHEPEHFKVELEGEEIVDVDLRLGYMHRGIEKGLQDRNYHRGIYLAERVCGICSVAHSLSFALAAEDIADMQVPERADYIRTIVAELERLHSHILWAGVAGEEVGFQTLFMTMWRDREKVMDLLEMVTGNRVNYSINRVGGVREDIEDKHAEKILKNLESLEEDLKRYVEIFPSDSTVLARMKDKGILPKKKAQELSASGPVMRGSDIKRDVRADDPYAAYGEIPFDVPVETGEDVLAKAVVRLRECLESIEIIRYALDAMPEGSLMSDEVQGMPIGVNKGLPVGEVTGRVEAARGDLMYHMKSEGEEEDGPSRVKIRTPTLANIPAVFEMLEGESMAEVPIVLASIDQCFSCTERIAIVDKETHEKEIKNMQELREMER